MTTLTLEMMQRRWPLAAFLAELRHGMRNHERGHSGRNQSAQWGHQRPHRAAPAIGTVETRV
jgi:hypothetical protein